MGDGTCDRRDGQMEFLLGNGTPGPFGGAVRGSGAEARQLQWTVLFQRNPHDSRDDTRTGDKRAAQST